MSAWALPVQSGHGNHSARLSSVRQIASEPLRGNGAATARSGRSRRSRRRMRCLVGTIQNDLDKNRPFTDGSNHTFLRNALTQASQINPVFSCSAVGEPALSFGVGDGGRECLTAISLTQALAIGARGFCPAATNACRSRMASRRSTRAL